MMVEHTGGPAFPSTIQYFPEDTSYHDNQGMLLRDYFAAKAMQSMMGTLWMAAANKELPIKDALKDITSVSYAMADAMLAAREK